MRRGEQRWSGVRRSVPRGLAACLGALVALLVLPLAVSAVGTVTPAPHLATVDLGDFDPALVPFVAALTHVGGVTAPGTLRAILTDSRGVTLRFTGVTVFLPKGKVEQATIAPLVQTLLDRSVTAPLIPESTATYAQLAEVERQNKASGPKARVINANGVIGILAPKDIPAPVTPSPFVAVVNAAAPSGDALARHAFETLRVGVSLGEPVWIRGKDGGLLLVQPFTGRVLVWNPRAKTTRATDFGDAAIAGRLLSDGPLGPTLAAVVLRLMDVPGSANVAITFTNQRGTTTVSWGGLSVSPSASVMKLAILATYEDAIQHGGFPRTAETERLAELMIVNSSNDAANRMIDLLGRGRINAYLRQLGLTKTYLGAHFEIGVRGDDGDNVSAPRESARLMTALVNGESGNAAQVRDLLARSQAPGSVRPTIAQPNAPLYEKRGWYPGIENDVLRVQVQPNMTVTLAIFQPNVRDVNRAYSLFSDLTTLGVRALNEGRVK